MKGFQSKAIEYLSYGLNPVPVADDKTPLREKHSSLMMTEDEVLDYDFNNIGVSTGIISGGLEAIDFDLKNAEDPKMIMKIFKSKVPINILNKVIVQQTISGGFHMIYRCEDVASSRKLAKNPEGLAIIETRGEGGYIKCAPSKGYKLLQGSFDKIPILEPKERLQLFISAKMLNATLIKEARKRATAEDNKYLKKFPDYNNDLEIGLDILYKNGWTKHSEDSVWVNLTRPEKSTRDGISGGYNKDGKFFFVFSTSQNVFELERAYNNHAIFAELECDGRYDVAYAKLYDEGYGDEDDEDKTKQEQEETDWEESLESLSFLSDDIEENTYLEQVRKDEVPQGLSFGWRDLDEYMLAKPNSLNIGLGYDGVGKSLGMLSMVAATETLHNWKWGIIAPENKTGMTRRRLIELKYGKPVKHYKNNELLFAKYKEESRDSFKIMSNKKHYSIDDVLEMGKRLYEEYGITALLIDPYNFFKVTGNGYSFNNDMLSKMRVFSETYCSVYVMAHPSSQVPRENKDNTGYLKAPSKYSIQGGADFPYRVDDFFVFHRIVNHEDSDVRRTMQVIVEKVKEIETGGKVHSNGEWSELIYETRDGFLGYWDSNGDNPMYKAMVSKMGVRAKLKRMTAEEAFS